MPTQGGGASHLDGLVIGVATNPEALIVVQFWVKIAFWRLLLLPDGEMRGKKSGPRGCRGGAD